MLKIWLTWLQPSLGILGVLLVLSSPLCSFAADKPSQVGHPSKNSAKQPQLRAVIAGGTTIEKELQLSGIAGTPDLAVRQLAVGAMTVSSSQPIASAASIRQLSNRNAMDGFLTPSAKKLPSLAKTAKPKSLKRSVSSVLARAVKPKVTAPIVAGLFIGKSSEVRLASPILPNAKQIARPIASSAGIGAPTSLAAMMAAPNRVDPFPVVSPALMQKLGSGTVIGRVPTTKPAPAAINPIATIPSRIKKAPQAIAPISAATPIEVNRAAPHSLDPIAKIPSGFRQEMPNSLDPIAAIPSGLQRMLGNNLGSEPQLVANNKAAKTSPKADNSLVALQPLLTPKLVASTSTPELTSGLSLQLATARAYTSVPKFDIPGERLASPSLGEVSKNDVVTQRPTKKEPTLLVVKQQQHKFVALSGDRHLEPQDKQAWSVIGQRNNLGGLILGSQSPSAQTKNIGRLVSVDKLQTLPTKNISGAISGTQTATHTKRIGLISTDKISTAGSHGLRSFHRDIH